MNGEDEYIYTADWSRKFIIAIIKNDLDNWIIKELPVKKDKEKHTNTFTYIFTKEIPSYEFIE